MRMALPVNGSVAVRNRGLHIDLLREELDETTAALSAGDVVGVADGLADLIVVALGVAADCGIDLSPVFDEVMKSNATKTPGNLRPDGKLGKGDAFVRPDLETVLAKQGWKR